MRKLMKYTKFVWMAVLFSVFILASMPHDINAEPEDEPAQDELMASEYSIEMESDFPFTITYGGEQSFGKWYVSDNAWEIVFEITPSEHYKCDVWALIGDNEAYVSQEDNVFTIWKDESGVEVIDDDVLIYATKVPITHTVTVSDLTGDNATFAPVAGMKATEETGKYTVSEADGYSFSVTVAGAAFIPKVTIADIVQTNPNPSEGVYTYSVDAGYPTADQTVTVEVVETYTLTVDLGENSGITKFDIFEYSNSAMTDIVKIKTVTSDGETLEFNPWNYLVVRDIEGPDENVFIRAEKILGPEDITTQYGCVWDSFVIGQVPSDFTLSMDARKLPVSSVTVKGDPYEPDAYSVSLIIDDYYISEGCLIPDDFIDMDLALSPIDEKYNYRLLSGNAGYRLADEDEADDHTLPIRRFESSFFVSLPFKLLSQTAFAGGLELTVGAEKAGYRDQTVSVIGYDKTNCKAVVDGEIVEYSGGWKIPYGTDVDVTISAKDGYSLNAVRIAPAMIVDSISPGNVDAWLKKRNNRYVTTVYPDDGRSVAFTIPNVEEPYYVYAEAPETEDYALYADSVKVQSGAEIDAYYNLTKTIELKKGPNALVIGDTGNWEVKAFIGEKEVTDKAFPSLQSTDKKIVFTGLDDEVQGSTVDVKIRSKEDVPKEFTLKIRVSKAVKPEDLSWGGIDKVALILGVDTRVELATGAGFDKDSYLVNISGMNAGMTKFIDYEKSDDGKAVVFKTKASKGYDIPTSGEDMKVSLVDVHNRNSIISGPIPIVRSTAWTENAKTALAGMVSVEPGTDTLTFRFSDSESFDNKMKNMDGLYYKISATQTTSPKNSDFEDKTDILVPATASKYDLVVAKDNDVVATESVTYKIEISFVQMKYYDGKTFVPGNVIDQTEAIEKTATIKPGGVFATKLTFNKNKDKDYAKIYSTMKDVVLGTVSFPDADSKKQVTVQRLKKVDVTDKNGKVLFTTENPNHEKVIRIRKSDNAVILNPHEASKKKSVFGGYDYDGRFAGDFRVVAYAVEPKGVDVSVTVPLQIAQGITELDVCAPKRIYKAPGKAVSIKATVDYSPSEKPLTKKVEWSLTKTGNGREPFSCDGVTIKNGVISIANNVAIPAGGLKFYVCVRAADYALHTDLLDTQLVEVHSQPQVPTYLIIGEKTEIKNGGSYYTSDISGYFTAYDQNMKEIEATYTISGLTPIRNIYNVILGAGAEKPVKKASVTVTATDGSKLSKKFEFAVVSDTGLKIKLYDFSGDPIQKKDGNDYIAVNKYPAGKPLKLYVWGSHDGVIEHSIKTDSGIKKVKSGNDIYYGGTWYELSAAKATGVVTITDNSDSNKKQTKITITNRLITSGNTGAPRITAENRYDTGYDAKKGVQTKDNKGNIFCFMDYESMNAYNSAGSYNKVTYTLMKNAKDPFEGDIIISTNSYILAGIFNNSAALTQAGFYEYKTTLKTGGKFTVDFIDSNGKLDITPGTYSFTVTPVDQNGVATAKPATFKFNAAAAPKAKVTVGKTSFAKFLHAAEFGPFKVQNIVFKEGDGASGSAAFTGDVRGINTKGTINKFATTFATTSENGAIAYGTLTCIREPDNPGDYDGGKLANGMSGYVGYKWTNLDGTTDTAFAKVSVKPDGNKPFEPVTE